MPTGDLRNTTRDAGFTIIELTMALGVFMLVAGLTAEVLVSHYAALDVTHQRTEAMRNAAGILSDMRAARDESRADFPGLILAEWPQAVELKDAPEARPIDRHTSLPEEALVVTYIDKRGRVLTESELKEQVALRVKVTSRWKTLRGGRWAEASIQTVLSSS